MPSDDIDLLIYQLAASLPPPQYAAFIADAYRALAGIPHLGCGLAYRVLRELQRHHFDPPPDKVASHPSSRHRRASKLASGPPLADGREVSNRRFKVVTW
jgi:hypothetical protein